MKNLKEVLDQKVQIRACGFDDCPFILPSSPQRAPGTPVDFCGIVTSGIRFEGMVFSHCMQDGLDSTDSLISILKSSKFLPQLHVVLTDGIAFGGLNVLDLPRLSDELGLPVIAVMRKAPNLVAVRAVALKLPDSETRLARLDAAGPVIELDGFIFQCMGCPPDLAARVLGALTDESAGAKIPECLRMAHLIGSAIKTGQSSRNA